MRVLWFSPGFAGHEQDFNCIPPMQMLAAALQRRGIDIQVVTLGYPFHGKPYLWRGIPVRSGYGFNGKHVRWLNWLRVLHYAGQAHQKHPFDVVHSFWLGPAWLIGRYFAARRRIPHLCTLMGQDVLPGNRYLKLLRPEHGPGLVALSGFQQENFHRSTGFWAGQTIPFGIEPETIFLDATQTARTIDIMGCGSFIPLKNWPKWLKTIALCRQKRPGLRAVLVGDGPERARLESLAESLGIRDCVQFVGHVPRARVLAYMRESKIFLHTADYESFGFVLAEAVACGCRVLSTRVGAAAELAQCADTPEALSETAVAALDRPGVPNVSVPLMDDCARAYADLYRNPPTKPTAVCYASGFPTFAAL